MQTKNLSYNQGAEGIRGLTGEAGDKGSVGGRGPTGNSGPPGIAGTPVSTNYLFSQLFQLSHFKT